jgi:hypothetical protein
MKQPERIVVTIDRLVLKGVAPENAAAFTAALRESLNQALGLYGVPAGASIALASVPRQSLAANDTSRGLGTAAGLAVHRAIRQGLKGGLTDG